MPCPTACDPLWIGSSAGVLGKGRGWAVNSHFSVAMGCVLWGLCCSKPLCCKVLPLEYKHEAVSAKFFLGFSPSSFWSPFHNPCKTPCCWTLLESQGEPVQVPGVCVLLALVLCSLHLLHGAVPRALGALGCEHSLRCPSVIVTGWHILHVVSCCGCSLCWLLSMQSPAPTALFLLPTPLCGWGPPPSRDGGLSSHCGRG